MESNIVSKGMTACSHGGIYSVNPRLVKQDCSSSVNPLGTPSAAIRAVQQNAKSLAPVYPDPEYSELKKNLSRYLQVNPNSITVGNGAIEIIHWFAQAFARNRVVVPAPTFCEYELASYRTGAKVSFIPLSNFELRTELVIEKSRGADAIFLCNPNNPTGILSTESVVKIIESADSKTKILLDECFIELSDRPGNSMITRIKEFDNLVILRSLTKSFGLAGLRIGYSICNPDLARKLAANRIPWNVNGLAQVAGVAALKDANNYLERTRTLVRKERKFLQDKINKMESFRALKSDANYFLVHLPHDSTKFRDRLLRKTGVLVRDCSTFTGMDSHHVRVAVKTHAQNQLLLKAMESLDDG